MRPLVFACLRIFAASVLILAMRAGIRRIGSRFGWWGYPVVFFGCGDAAGILRKLKQQPHLGLRPVAVVTDQFSTRKSAEFRCINSRTWAELRLAGSSMPSSLLQNYPKRNSPR